MNDHREHGRELTTQEEFESIRLLAEGYSDTTPVATRYKDVVPAPTQPTVGNALPFAQHGRPPMSQKATDHATLVIVYTWGSLPVGGAISLVLWQLSSVSPMQLTFAGLGAAGVFIAIGAAARMIGRAFRDGASALPDHTVNQYTGTVYVQHTELHTNTRGLGRTNNQITDGQQ
ncbi:hypothetical protein [Streptomyces violaceusniger]|uniref:Uncharacterized protein n=1 Tax=Streptomyces violaceusniger (strain Tu 4113) TaxID=653045 RepID=G2PGV0_STRV4|nr:hypothetical protein [Streptomyces violaceusniger]AEM88664.1 hypothetical protein Strvi_9407 [Streptomyces violaceusniger Tu 4113]